LQSLAVFRNLADAWSAGSLLTDLGGLTLSHGELSRGIDFFRQATDAFQQHGGHRRGLARVLEGVALAPPPGGAAQRARHAADAGRTAAGHLWARDRARAAEPRRAITGVERRLDDDAGSGDR